MINELCQCIGIIAFLLFLSLLMFFGYLWYYHIPKKEQKQT